MFLSVRSLYNSPGSRPITAVISAASSPRMIPSLSVVQTVPLRRRNAAPALSSPAKPSVPATNPSTNHLKPTGTSNSWRWTAAVTRSIMLLLTTVLPTPVEADHAGRWRKR